MMRARVENTFMDHAQERVRVTVIEKFPHAVMVWDQKENRWVEVSRPGPGVALPDDIPAALDLPEEIARVVYETLREHFGDADVAPMKFIKALAEESEARRQRAEDAIREIALFWGRNGPEDIPSGN